MEQLPLIDNVLLAYKQMDCRWEGPMIYMKLLYGNNVATFRFSEDQREKAREFKTYAEESGHYVDMWEEPLILLNRHITRY